MFDKLKKVFSDFISSVTGKISEKDIEEFFKEREIDFIEADVSIDVIEYFKQKLIEEVKNVKVNGTKSETLKELLEKTIAGIFQESETLPEIYGRSPRRPFVIVFLGINGTGKTTTVAKVAYYLKKMKLKPLMVAADTYRTGAIEQLAEHGSRIGVEVYSKKYGADPAALSREAYEYAQANSYEILLIDTAGRMQTNESLLNELAKLVNVVKSDLNVFVGDALAGYDMINQATTFLQNPGFSHSIVTKVDAEVKGGSILNLAFYTKKPIMYLGTGQSYEDLTPFKPSWVVERLLG
ncbi:MAG: signal recognition particle receptor subunit alpha [Nitrososphaeria archaeon]|nr:signal recognition particle receptor subunit alpha [Conexivisphaerales archaeon]